MMAFSKLRLQRRWLVVFCIGTVLLGLTAALAGFRYFRAEVLAESTDDQSFRGSSMRVVSAAGRPPLLTLDAETLRFGVIASHRLETIHFQPSVPAVGSAVDPVDLASTRDLLVEARKTEAQATTNLTLADSGTDSPLFSLNLPSDADSSVQMASDTTRLDEADVRAAADAVRLRRAVALALYGPGLTSRMKPDDSELAAILQGRASLLLLTPLPGYDAPLPVEATARGRGGESVPAHLLSVAYRIDPRFQNIAALYETAADPANPHFLPGPSFSASLPVGPILKGVVVPAAAVLQSDGKAWAYVEESPQRFRRQEVSLAHALPDGSGWFQERAYQADQTVVVAGAALLLEEEK